MFISIHIRDVGQVEYSSVLPHLYLNIYRRIHRRL